MAVAEEQQTPCLRCGVVVATMGVPPEGVPCGDVTHELAKRFDSERVRDVAARVAALAEDFGRHGGAWIDRTERAGRTLLAIAERAREREAELDRRYSA